MSTYITLILLLVIYLYLSLIIKNYYFINTQVFMSNKNQYVFSCIYMFLFLLFFLFLFRFLRIFFIQNLYIDLFALKLLTEFYVKLLGINSIFIFIFIFIFLKKLFISITKFHFIRLYYVHYTFFSYCIDFILVHYYKRKKFFDKIIIYFNYFLLLLFIFFLLKALYIDKGFFLIVLFFYYALYFFFLNFFKFLLQLNSEFDLVSAYVYKGINVSFEGFLKLKEYHMYLVLSESEYVFVTKYQSVKNKTKENYLFLSNNVDFFLE